MNQYPADWSIDSANSPATTGLNARGISPYARPATTDRNGAKYVTDHGTNYSPSRANRVSKKERNKAKKLARKAAAQ